MRYLDLCPCCGDYAFLMNDSNSILNYYGYPCYYVQCHGCGLRTTKGDMDEVIEKWNRRVYNEHTETVEDFETQMD